MAKLEEMNSSSDDLKVESRYMDESKLNEFKIEYRFMDDLKLTDEEKKDYAPRKMHKNDACYDIYCMETVTIPKDKKVSIRTGIWMRASLKHTRDPCYISIHPRSSTFFKERTLWVFPGTIDYDFPHEIKIGVLNLAEEVTIEKGERIAQFSIHLVPIVEFVETSEIMLGDRKGGFGSTGKK